MEIINVLNLAGYSILVFTFLVIAIGIGCYYSGAEPDRATRRFILFFSSLITLAYFLISL